ncbi:MAG: hypothetical protein LBT50_00445, partial [Prevotellaceae bacterium]|nr:hypothetical protein [Prevotellaceae bacterium]
LFKDKLGFRFLHVNSKTAYDYYDSSSFPLYYDAKDGLMSNMDFSPDLDKREELLKLPEERFIIFEYEFK